MSLPAALVPLATGFDLAPVTSVLPDRGSLLWKARCRQCREQWMLRDMPKAGTVLALLNHAAAHAERRPR